MLVKIRDDASNRRASPEIHALAGANVFCSEFRYRRGAEIFGEAEPAEHIYQISEGAVRSYRLLSDVQRVSFSG